MDKKNILIAIVLTAAILAGLVLWRNIHPPRKHIIVKKKIIVSPIAIKKVPALSPVTRKYAFPKIAIVIDDFGYTTANLETFFSARVPLTFSILPNVRYSAEVSRIARGHGYEVILHLPLEPHKKNVGEEIDTIKSGMGERVVISRLEKDIAGIPGITGVSNHMGSKATEDKVLMAEILGCLKKHNLYFFDSLTSDKSVCREVAEAVGIPFAKRNIFLDNSNKVDSIGIELADLEKLALKRGWAIAICHDRKNTAIALAEMMPQMVKDGVEFVYLSEMEK